jgi:predicted hydrolase (HD superfamily)
MDRVVERLTTDTCLLAGYEEWDEDEDKKWILKFFICDSDYEMTPEYN